MNIINNISPWGIDKSKTPEDQIKDYKRIEDEFDNFVLDDIGYVATILCVSMTHCKHCPVDIYNLDNRTNDEKAFQAVTCQELLHKWLVDEFAKLNTK